MSLELPGHAAPAVGFEAPLAMLSACHGRIEQQCNTLRRIAPYLATHGADAQVRDAAAAVMRYFDSAAVHHHADEERDLFPALIESMAGSDAVCVRELTANLVAEHRELEAHWRQVRSQLAPLAAGTAATLAADDVDVLVALYERHIAREEAELLPLAARLLGEAEHDRIGRAMRERRGIPPV
ncbi:MAG TPA: hemerythrin domain-containing protein [Burkholderiaceae bacterium]|nr:hemerythrin domain-containing protein [Burkholderiaceae bacterium]